MGIFPLSPKDPLLRKHVQSVFVREVKVYRRKPTFIIGISLWGVSLLALIPLTGLLSKLLIVVSVFGAAFVYDTVAAHFSQCILELEQQGHPDDDNRQPSLSAERETRTPAEE